MKNRISYSVSRNLLAASLVLLSVVQLRATDVRMYSVFKAQLLAQTNSGAATPLPGSGFQFQGEVDSASSGTLTSAFLTLPNSTVLQLFPNGDGNNLKIKQNFDTASAMDAAFPDGTYTSTVHSVNDGGRTNALFLTGGGYPATPHINNFSAAQSIDPASDFLLSWDPISGATTNDYIQVSIRDCHDSEFFQTAEYGKAGALNGAATGVTLPAGTLHPGANYSLQLIVAHASTYDTNSYPGAAGLAAYFKAVQMGLATTGTPEGCSAGSLQLVFNFNQGSFGSGTNGTISFPQPLSYYFALFNVDNDSDYPATVTFSGPAGSGLSNTTNQYNGSSFGQSAYYATPQVNLPPFPPGGIYTVNYKGNSNNFNLLNPNSASQQVMIVPSVVVNASNVVTQINWVYKNTNGATIAAQPFMKNIELRVDGFTGRLYDAGNNDNNNTIAPSSNSHLLSQVVSWTNVTGIQMVFYDFQGNQYDSYWNRNSQPVSINTTNLYPATQGAFYSYLLSATGGSQQFTWSVPSNSLPAGLSLNPITGEISGTPSPSGSFNLNVTVTDTYTQTTNRMLTLVVSSAPASRPNLSSPVRLANGHFKFHVNGTAGQTYTLQTSPDLFNWTSIITLAFPDSSFDITDPNSGGGTRKFYRLAVEP
jgi:hypothetical protein